MNEKLNPEEIEELFSASLQNAFSLSDVAVKNLQSPHKHISLGLAEICLEEIGKSYMCLAYYNNEENEWSKFWKEWRNHKLKAARGLFYEFFSLVRLELPNWDKTIVSKRKLIPLEKEASFYVDFDMNNREVIIPNKDIEDVELYNRVMSIMAPLITALKIRDKFIKGTPDYKNAYSDYARITLELPIFQQDALNVLEAMKIGNDEYNKAITDIIDMVQSSETDAEKWAKSLGINIIS